MRMTVKEGFDGVVEPRLGRGGEGFARLRVEQRPQGVEAHHIEQKLCGGVDIADWKVELTR